MAMARNFGTDYSLLHDCKSIAILGRNDVLAVLVLAKEPIVSLPDSTAVAPLIDYPDTPSVLRDIECCVIPMSEVFITAVNKGGNGRTFGQCVVAANSGAFLPQRRGSSLAKVHDEGNAFLGSNSGIANYFFDVLVNIRRGRFPNKIYEETVPIA